MTLNEQRKANSIPFNIVGWFGEVDEVGFDIAKGKVYEAEAVLQDQFGVYNATVWTTEWHKRECGQPWMVKALDNDEESKEQ